MHPFPHRYTVEAAANLEGDITLAGERLAPIRSAPPVEFGGPGDRWSPETLLVAAAADCFVLTFRAIAAASKLPWLSLRCEATGTVDRVERAPRFTELFLRIALDVPAGADNELASRVLTKAKQACLVTNSLKAESRIESEVCVVR
jgi:organic hydroperoxide reductase OsmC/OhrA